MKQSIEAALRLQRFAGAILLSAVVVLLPCSGYARDSFLFVYFKEPANMGVFYAVSDDGYRWQPLNGGKPWLPIQEKGELMRDPFCTRGPDGQFHMVWTWSWSGQSIGYAHSPDLVMRGLSCFVS